MHKQAEVLKKLSRRDELTDLLNRRAFDEHATTLFAQAKRFNHPLTLGLADIDYFKKVNDEYSHATGATVLKEIAKLISKNLRRLIYLLAMVVKSLPWYFRKRTLMVLLFLLIA